MSHHDRCIRERVIALVEKGGFPASTDGGMRMRMRDEQVGRRKGTWLWRVSSPAQDATLVAEAE